ncbi:MAG: rod shape-determining protein MreC [Nitriliruptoraceae bacterium]|nr:rod shape-determining protein MreC [Nitriliruptoraceae bacterium]
MSQRRARVLLAVLLVAALVLVTVDFRSEPGGRTDGVRGVVTTVTRPLQDGVSALVRPFTTLGDTVNDLFATRGENRRLREQVATLQQRRASAADLERENVELRELLAIRDRTELPTVTARTVALAPSNFEWTITIDVGSNDGIERDMPVIDGDGLVGRVIQVTPNASRVLLAIDPTFAAAARVADSGEIGTIDGRGGDPMLMRPLDPEAGIEVGDEIVTSSYQGGVFPAGIPIGTVSSVPESASRLTSEVLVNPFVDFTRLHHVLVILVDPTEDVPPFEGSEGLDFLRPPVPPVLEPALPGTGEEPGGGTGEPPDDGSEDDEADGDDP